VPLPDIRRTLQQQQSRTTAGSGNKPGNADEIAIAAEPGPWNRSLALVVNLRTRKGMRPKKFCQSFYPHLGRVIISDLYR
jgi:hypothetical protein